jgi:twitching motility protein PilI
MARRINLRDFQQALLERLHEVENAPASISKLGFLVGSERWLVSIDATEEVLPMPRVAPFPFTRPWFLGVSNVRGNLIGVVDFLHFLTDAALPRAPHNRVIVLAGASGARFGVLVSRMLGLRRSEELRNRHEAAPASALVAAVYEDADGSVWNELDVAALLSDRRFIDVGAV